ncbi:MAG: ChaN family lipoprotein, partial [Desulfobacteraceae bacterium]|nr:ChaN family lipoprotein [Desulfobacteraceae bacterium]
PENRRRMQEEYSVHGKDRIRNFESFYEAQLAWEETMAETLTGRLQATSGKCRIIVILGKGHMRNRLGVPHLTALRVPHEFRTVAPMPVDYPSSVFDPDIAEYVLLTDKSEPVHRPRMGVAVQPAASGRGAEILRVMPDTPAAKADLRKGDVIVSIDAVPVNGAEDIQRVLAESGPSHRLEVLRGKKRMTIEAEVE